MTVEGVSELAWPAVTAVSLGLFLAPGLLGAAALARREVVPATAVALTAVAVSSTLGYTVFWAYLAGEGIGRAASGAACAAGLAALAAPRTRRLLWRTIAAPAVGVPLAVMLLVAVLYNGLLFAHGSATQVEQRANVHLLGGNGLPIDNLLPLIFADRLYDGADPRPLYGDWRSSDRPPLQTGAVLVQRPLASVLGIDRLHYQLLASALQCSWVAAVWALCAAAGFRRRATALALAMATFSGFFFLNSLFVWPKLYAASFVALAYALLVGRRPTWPSAAVAAGAVGLGLLAHAGIVFTLVPLAVVVMVRRTRPGLVPALAGALTLAVALGPWWAYARFYDPPGNRLTKWHLAGVVDIDDRSSRRALIDAYTDADLDVLVRNKVENLTFLARPLPRWSDVEEGGAERLRQREFFVVAWSLGALNLGWAALAAGFARRTRRLPGWRGGALMLAVAAAGLLVWVLAMFGPGATMVHQGSYATMLLLWVGLAGVIGARSRWWWPVGLAAAQVVYFVMVWARDLPGPGSPVRLGDASAAGVAGVLVLAVLGRLAASPEAPADAAGEPPPPGAAEVEAVRDLELSAGAPA